MHSYLHAYLYPRMYHWNDGSIFICKSSVKHSKQNAICKIDYHFINGPFYIFCVTHTSVGSRDGQTYTYLHIRASRVLYNSYFLFPLKNGTKLVHIF